MLPTRLPVQLQTDHEESKIGYADAIGGLLQSVLRISTPIRISPRIRSSTVPTGARISRAASSIASMIGKPTLTARTIKSIASGKISRNWRWFRLCRSRTTRTGAPTAAAPAKAIERAGRPSVTAAAKPTITAAMIAVAAKCVRPIRLPAAARALSSRDNNAAGRGLRCGRARRKDATTLSTLDVAMEIAFKRGSMIALRLSTRRA